jgi:O-antigen ligase
MGLLLFAIYGFKNVELLSNLIGTVLVSFCFYNYKLKDLFQKYAVNIYILFSLYFCFAFYFGVWETSTAGRASIMKHNENYLAQLLNIGFTFSLIKYVLSVNKREKRLYLIGTILHVAPIIATVSRTGITLMIFTFVFILWNKFDRRARYLLVVYTTLFVLVGGSVFTQLLNRNEFVKLYFERTSEAKEDERGNLWDIGIGLAEDNLFTGTGFDRFYDYEWRKSVGLYYEQYDAETNSVQTGFMSVHNSFIDLVLIGGIWLLIAFLLILFFPISNGIKLLDNPNYKLIGVFVLVLMINVIVFAFTGQGATQKITWFVIGICYFEIDTKTKFIG